MNDAARLRKNPSRETCESVIRRILNTELTERGKNEHFRQASDFMSYFESLYPASDALTKQVQRAVKAMGLPKDDRGYFIINKTKEQLKQEQMIREFLSHTKASADTLPDCEPLLFSVPSECTEYLIQLICTCDTFRGKFVTAVKSYNGILFFTRCKKELQLLLEDLI